MDATISQEVLRESDPAKLLQKLLALRDSGGRVAAARAVTAGVSGSGKTHLRRRLTEADSPELAKPLDRQGEDGIITIGAVVRETQLTPAQHQCDQLPAISLVVVDVGGHHEQLYAHHNFIYLAGQSVFLLCLHAHRPFDEWGKYYLSMIQDLTRLRYSERGKGRSFLVNDLRELIRPEEKTPVVIVPTHADESATAGNQNLPADLAAQYPLLDIVQVAPINNLKPTAPVEVRKKLGEQLKKLPAVCSLVQGYVVPVRREVRRYFQPGSPGDRFPVSMSLQELQTICEKHSADDLDYVVRELLRLGDVIVPLKDMPDDTQRVADHVTRLLNPRFVNDYLYRVVMDAQTRQQNGFMSEMRFEEITASLSPQDRKLLRELLTQYLVVFRWEKLGREEGFFVPDLFHPRPPGTFEPWEDAPFDRALPVDGFVPEHTFFRFLSHYEPILEPIDRRNGVYLFRDACLLADGQAKAQVYANVLQREFRVVATGPEDEAAALGQRLINWLAEETGTKPPSEAGRVQRADVLLVTVNKHETQAVREAFQAVTGKPATPCPIGPRVYHDLGTVDGTRVFHAHSKMGTVGPGRMQQTVEMGIAALEPGAVIAVGIAFGVNPKKQSIGDILVSEQLRHYDPIRVGKKDIPRGAKPDASSRLIDFFEAARPTWQGAAVRPGVILTGEKLVDNLRFRKQLVELEPEAVGGDMEAAGLYAACHENGVDWIVIKAISDWADGKKSKNKTAWQKKAAMNAAQFVLHALSYSPLPKAARKLRA